jgi:TonB family protein
MNPQRAARRRLRIGRILLGLSLAGITGGGDAAASPALTIGTVPRVQAGETPPKLRRRPVLEVPFDVYLAGVDGKVTVEFVVDPNGRVVDPVIVSSSNPAYDRPALRSITSARFDPALADGKPVPRKVDLLLDYDVAYGRPDTWRVLKPANHHEMPPELQWDEAPEPLWTAFPVYPYDCAVKGGKGRALVRFFVDPQGRVVDVSAVGASGPEFAGAAIAAIETWKFKPAKRAGKPCFAIVQLEQYFAVGEHRAVPLSPADAEMVRELQRRPKSIVPLEKLDSAPEPRSRRPPHYPGALLAKGVSGEATIEFLLDYEGFAQLPRIVSATHPEFGYAAAHAVSSWRFSPPLKDGKPVVARVSVPLVFNAAAPAPR